MERSQPETAKGFTLDYLMPSHFTDAMRIWGTLLEKITIDRGYDFSNAL